MPDPIPTPAAPVLTGWQYVVLELIKALPALIVAAAALWQADNASDKANKATQRADAAEQRATTAEDAVKTMRAEFRPLMFGGNDVKPRIDQAPKQKVGAGKVSCPTCGSLDVHGSVDLGDDFRCDACGKIFSPRER